MLGNEYDQGSILNCDSSFDVYMIFGTGELGGLFVQRSGRLVVDENGCG